MGGSRTARRNVSYDPLVRIAAWRDVRELNKCAGVDLAGYAHPELFIEVFPDAPSVDYPAELRLQPASLEVEMVRRSGVEPVYQFVCRIRADHTVDVE